MNHPWQYLKLVQETSPGKFLKLLNYYCPLLYFLQADSEFGSLREGLRADIVILGDNPMLNLAALRDIHGVVVRGVYLDADEIEAMLVRVEQARSQ